MPKGFKSRPSVAARIIHIVSAVVRAPRFRRYVLVYIVLLSLFWGSWTKIASPALQELEDLNRALDPKTRDNAGGWFGSNALPGFNDMVQQRSMDPSLIPGNKSMRSTHLNRRRLIVVGDVHGCKDELEKLLDKVSFNREKGDHLIFTGNLITKGPHSLEVVHLARKYRASCVRGSAEDRVLLTRRSLESNNLFRVTRREGKTNVELSDADVEDLKIVHGIDKERFLALQLSDADAKWLESCPVILNVGNIGRLGHTVVVHAGLIPGVSLERQDPTAVMGMRSIDLDTHIPSTSRTGLSWEKLFNKYQSRLAANRKVASPIADAHTAAPTTVIYGHDAHPSVSIRKYTMGLGASCVSGGKLNALIIGDGGSKSVRSVRCYDYMSDTKQFA
ncbi:hypothetical protein FQN57_007186 [Myotisia sp. PD_48]|nr:hypothetical protein FQN57_007186 [Myotisia sp. PD_48]